MPERVSRVSAGTAVKASTMPTKLIVIVSLSHSLGVAIASLCFLIVIHKLEYFLNARLVGTRIEARAWELLIAMLTMEAAFGITGVVAAPIYYAYLKDELKSAHWFAQRAARNAFVELLLTRAARTAQQPVFHRALLGVVDRRAGQHRVGHGQRAAPAHHAAQPRGSRGAIHALEEPAQPEEGDRHQHRHRRDGADDPCPRDARGGRPRHLGPGGICGQHAEEEGPRAECELSHRSVLIRSVAVTIDSCGSMTVTAQARMAGTSRGSCARRAASSRSVSSSSAAAATAYDAAASSCTTPKPSACCNRNRPAVAP